MRRCQIPSANNCSPRTKILRRARRVLSALQDSCSGNQARTRPVLQDGVTSAGLFSVSPPPCINNNHRWSEQNTSRLLPLLALLLNKLSPAFLATFQVATCSFRQILAAKVEILIGREAHARWAERLPCRVPAAVQDTAEEGSRHVDHIGCDILGGPMRRLERMSHARVGAP